VIVALLAFIFRLLLRSAGCFGLLTIASTCPQKLASWLQKLARCPQKLASWLQKLARCPQKLARCPQKLARCPQIRVCRAVQGPVRAGARRADGRRRAAPVRPRRAPARTYARVSSPHLMREKRRGDNGLRAVQGCAAPPACTRCTSACTALRRPVLDLETSMQLSIRTDFREVQAMLDQLPSRLADQAARNAINRTVAHARTRMQREITREFALPAAVVRERLTVKRATFGRGGEAVIRADLTAGGKRAMNLIRFLEKSVTLAEGRRRARAGTRGRLFVQIRRTGGRQMLPEGSFIGNGGRTVFQRLGEDRLPIRALSTIDVPQMFNTRRVNDAVMAAVRDFLPKRMAHEIRFALRGRP
jgi:hypothetical protein